MVTTRMLCGALRFVVSTVCFLTGWILAEAGIFGYPGTLLMDATDIQLIKAFGALVGITLTFVGWGVFSIPLVYWLYGPQEQNNAVSSVR